MANGIVVDHKEAGVRYAVATENFDPKTMKRVRELKPGETVLGYAPKSLPVDAPEDLDGTATASQPADGPEDDQPDRSDDSKPTPHTKGTAKPVSPATK